MYVDPYVSEYEHVLPHPLAALAVVHGVTAKAAALTGCSVHLEAQEQPTAICLEYSWM